MFPARSLRLGNKVATILTSRPSTCPPRVFSTASSTGPLQIGDAAEVVGGKYAKKLGGMKVRVIKEHPKMVTVSLRLMQESVQKRDLSTHHKKVTEQAPTGTPTVYRTTLTGTKPKH